MTKGMEHFYVSNIIEVNSVLVIVPWKSHAELYEVEIPADQFIDVLPVCAERLLH